MTKKTKKKTKKLSLKRTKPSPLSRELAEEKEEAEDVALMDECVQDSPGVSALKLDLPIPNQERELADMVDPHDYPKPQEDIEIDFDKFTGGLRGAVARSLDELGMRLKESAGMRIAKLFYRDDKQAVQILKHLMPQLKSVEMKNAKDSPFQLLIDMRNSEAQAESQDDNEGEDLSDIEENNA
jgi:hypothetical protein